jgi:hypothetical protein
MQANLPPISTSVAVEATKKSQQKQADQARRHDAPPEMLVRAGRSSIR